MVTPVMRPRRAVTNPTVSNTAYSWTVPVIMMPPMDRLSVRTIPVPVTSPALRSASLCRSCAQQNCGCHHGAIGFETFHNSPLS